MKGREVLIGKVNLLRIMGPKFREGGYKYGKEGTIMSARMLAWNWNIGVNSWVCVCVSKYVYLCTFA